MYYSEANSTQDGRDLRKHIDGESFGALRGRDANVYDYWAYP
jgi:hypothetical protein